MALIGFALIDWNINSPGFAILVVNFALLILLTIFVSIVVYYCASSEE